jgi:phage shock protein PspC (stress-responsive transcriptional regulator)
MAELLQAKLNKAKQVINLSDVNEIRAQMGDPEDILNEVGQEEPVGEGNKRTEDPVFSAPKRIFRDPDDKVIGGVSAGLAAYFGLDPVWVRLIFVILLFSGVGIVPYIILWMVIPEAKTTADRLQMKGKPVNLSTIEKTIRQDLEGLGKKAQGFAKDTSKIEKPLTRALTTLFNFIGELLRGILNLIGKVFGFLFLLIGAFFLILFFMALVWPVINIDGTQLDLWSGIDYLKAMFGNSAAITLFIAGMAMTMVAAFVGIVLSGIRILFRKKAPSQVRTGIILTSVVGVILLFAGGSMMAREFSSEATYKAQDPIETQGKVLTIATPESDIPAWDEDTEFKWYLRDGKQIVRRVSFTIKPSTNGQTYLEREQSARGKTRTLAYDNANQFTYGWTQNDSVLHLPPTIELGDGQLFRSQEIRTILYLKEGERVYLDPSARQVIYDIDNVKNIWDHEMVGYTWEMRAEGLTCLDCPETLKQVGGNENIQIDENGIRVNVTEDGVRKKVIIDENGVQVEKEGETRIDELEKKIEELEKELEKK